MLPAWGRSYPSDPMVLEKLMQNGVVGSGR